MFKILSNLPRTEIKIPQSQTVFHSKTMFKSRFCQLGYSDWLVIYHSAMLSINKVFGDTDCMIGNPISYEIGFKSHLRFEVKSKRDRKSYLVRDRIFNLI